MKIIKKSNYFLLNKVLKLKKNIYFKNIKIIFEKFILNDNNKWTLICHALTGSHHFQGIYLNNLNNKGWWNDIISEKLIKNYKLNYLCLNNILSNFGSTNNLSLNPLNNNSYKNNFPNITIKNILKIQKLFLINIKINKLFLIIGGSMGGIQSIIWTLVYPSLIKNCLCIATPFKMSSYNLIKNKINKLLINYNKNNFKKIYFDYKIKFIKNLKLIRIIDHLSYLSNNDIKKKKTKIFFLKNYKYYNNKVKISKYFFYKSNNFYKKFNIISYIHILKLINKFNLNFYKKNIKNYNINYFIINFKNDKRFKLKNSKILKIFFIKKNFNINFKILKTKSGHDSFLIKEIYYRNIINFYINYISER